MPWFYAHVEETPGEGRQWHIGEYKSAVDAVFGIMRRYRPNAEEIEVYCHKIADRPPRGESKAGFTRRLRAEQRKPPAL